MSKYEKLNEGLTAGALDHLIQPLLSIDEYESKISDKRAIVVGFFVEDSDPARDLSNFIDRSRQPILDTEVSPSPTPDGFYLVFVEIQRDKNFPTVLISLIDEIENLTNVTDWSFQSPGNEDPIELNEENLKKDLILDQDEIVDIPEEDPKEDDEPKDLSEFWKSAMVDSVILEGNQITLLTNGFENSYLLHRSIPSAAAVITDNQSARYLQSLLGPAYGVMAIAEGFLVEHSGIGYFLTPTA